MVQRRISRAGNCESQSFRYAMTPATMARTYRGKKPSCSSSGPVPTGYGMRTKKAMTPNTMAKTRSVRPLGNGMCLRGSRLRPTARMKA